MAGGCLRREFMNNLIWRSVTCRPGKRAVLHKGKPNLAPGAVTARRGPRDARRRCGAVYGRGRVGAKDYSSAPLTEPDVRATHPALWIDISEVQRELNRNLRAVKPRRRRDRSFSCASLFATESFAARMRPSAHPFRPPKGCRQHEAQLSWSRLS